jgi:asparagine synthase (glutamine-hydrolysing)
MNDAITHRGPDAEGTWFDLERGIGLAHRRLAIIDLSEAGIQPMHSASGRFIITYNGEIYNYRELRATLESEKRAPAWRGSSDTEVLLAAIEAWGLTETLKRVRGMFAFGLWDREADTLSLARDPAGEKPLYVGRLGNTVVFGSELKALTAHPQWRGDIDRDAIAECIRKGQIGAPRSLWQNVRKVSPGTIMTLSREQSDPATAPETLYWDAFAEAAAARHARFEGGPQDAVTRLDALLHEVVSMQMVADVPLGAFLSGGIDSSTIAAVMQAVSDRPVQSFALGFHEKDANEAEFAKAIAAHLGLDHHEIYLSGEDAREFVADMPAIYDEPFTDSSQLATYLISRFARGTVTVALSGDAGDELFGGYNRYTKARQLWDGTTTGRIKRCAELTGISALDRAFLSPAERLGLAQVFGRNVIATRLQLDRRRATLAAPTPISGYEASFTGLDATHLLVPGAAPAHDALLERIAGEAGWSVLEQASFLDMVRYLPDDILVKVDRAAMAVSLETRIPMLDVEIMRFAYSLPDEIKLMGGESKGVLRGVLERYVPRPLWDRPKMGFGVPTAAWLRGPLFELASDLFSRDTLRRTGILDEDRVLAIWSEFQKNPNLRPKVVWTLFVTQLFLAQATA